MIIHGGTTCKDRRDYLKHLKGRKISIEKRINWAQDYLEIELGRNYQVIRPRMPLQDNAKYAEWEIHFKRFIPYLKDNIILIGNSLGGIFLAKYLSENKFPKKIAAVFLVCPPFDNSHSDEDLFGGFKLKSDLSLIEKNSSKLYLMFSKDDKCVPVYHAERYRDKLPKANIIIYKSKNGHFKVPKFPEIIRLIRNL